MWVVQQAMQNMLTLTVAREQKWGWPSSFMAFTIFVLFSLFIRIFHFICIGIFALQHCVVVVRWWCCCWCRCSCCCCLSCWLHVHFFWLTSIFVSACFGAWEHAMQTWNDRTHCTNPCIQLVRCFLFFFFQISLFFEYCDDSQGGCNRAAAASHSHIAPP